MEDQKSIFKEFDKRRLEEKEYERRHLKENAKLENRRLQGKEELKKVEEEENTILKQLEKQR